MIIVVAGLILLSSLHVIYFPLEVEKGTVLTGQVDVEGEISLSSIYQNLSEENYRLENITGNVTQEDCSGDSCVVNTREVSQIKIISDKWTRLNVIKIWVNPNGTVGLEGSSSMNFRHLFDAGATTRSSRDSEKRVVQMLETAGISVDQEDIQAAPAGIFTVSSLCLGMFVMIFFLSGLSALLIFKEREDEERWLESESWLTEEEREELLSKEDYSFDKVLTLLGTAGLLLILMHVFRESGYSDMACAMIWILPLTLVALGLLLFIPQQFRYAKLFLAGLVGLAMYLVFVVTQNPSSTCFVCCLAIPLVIGIIAFIFLLIRDMKDEGEFIF